MDMSDFLAPVLALIIWTLVVWIILYAKRLPALIKSGDLGDDIKSPDGKWKQAILLKIQAPAHNYNHLLEQPTIFYALMFFAALTGEMHAWVTYLGWAYFALRVLHSIIQMSATYRIELRFGVFALSTLCLFGMVGVILLA